MVATKISAAVAMAALRTLGTMKGKVAKTMFFSHAAAAAKGDITLPWYLDLSVGFPILSMQISNITAAEEFTYNLFNGTNSDQVVRTAVVADQPATTEFMVGAAAGTNPGNLIIIGDATTKTSQYAITAFWRDF
jgi:hypothetical protein